MLPLDSPRWHELKHAYGPATDVPAWLAALRSLPASTANAEPWFSIWSALAHQGDVYASSYAAVPHVVAALERDPKRADSSYFQFPAWVEICRAKTGTSIPKDLRASYFAALAKLPGLAALSGAGRQMDPELLACCMAALAAANGQTVVAEAALELTPEVASEFLKWLSER